MRKLLMLAGIVLALLCCWTREVQAQAPASPSSATGQTDYAAVRVEGRKLFDVMGGGGLTAEARADRINRRLDSLIARNEPVRPFTRQDISTKGNETTVHLAGEPIVTVTEADAEDALSTKEELALLWGGKMATAVADARAARANLVQGAGIVIRNSFQDLVVSVLKWLPRLAGGVVLLVVFFLLARVNRRIVKAVVTRTHFDGNLRQLLQAFAFYGTWTVGFIAILSTLGLDSGSIATTLGISGFVLGFAFKDILSHFFAGLMLLLGRQFHIGDQIVVKDYEGTVERIELRALYLRTYDNRLVIIPNGDVFTSAVTSNTASPHRRSEFSVGIGYDDDIDKARADALATVRNVEGVATDPAPDVLVDDLGASTVDLKVRFYAKSQRADYLRVGSECRRQVKEAFEREKISMPTDVMTVVIQNWTEVARAISNPAERNEPTAARALNAPADRNESAPLAEKHTPRR